MCGIASMLLYPVERPPEMWQAIKAAMTENLLYNEQRGKAATGLAVVQRDGRVAMSKQTIPAHEFVESAVYHQLFEQVGAETTLLLGHTRLPTKGDTRNCNNHPIQVGTVFGVHNGHINNDDALFARWHIHRECEVDSEIIFRLLEPFDPFVLNAQYLALIRPQLQYLEGKFTFIACDTRAPTKLMVVKHDNPLCLHYHREWQTLIFSSRYLFLRKYFGRAVISERLPSNQMLMFEADRLPQYTHQPVTVLPLYLYKGSHERNHEGNFEGNHEGDSDGTRNGTCHR